LAQPLLQLVPPSQAQTILIPSDRPVYRVLNPAGFFGPDDHLHPEGSVIIFDDEPNEHMEPLNELAREALQAHLEKLHAGARDAALKNGRLPPAQLRSVEDRLADARADARRAELKPNDGGVPLQGAKNARRKSRMLRLDGAAVPETGRTVRDTAVR